MKYDIFTPGEVAKRLNVTPQTVYNLIRDGPLNATNIGGGHRRPIWRIKEEDFRSMQYTKYHIRNNKVDKVEIIEVVEEPKENAVDLKAELSSLKEDLLSIVLRIEELENKIEES